VSADAGLVGEHAGHRLAEVLAHVLAIALVRHVDEAPDGGRVQRVHREAAGLHRERHFGGRAIGLQRPGGHQTARGLPTLT